MKIILPLSNSNKERKPQVFFDNLYSYKDNECQDEQFNGFKTEWEVTQYVSFQKPDNIEHVMGNNFKTPDGKTLKVVSSFYLEGKLLTEKQLEKLGIEVTIAHTKDCNIV
jgi:hypothetical protein